MKKGSRHEKLKNGTGGWEARTAWNTFIRMEHYYNLADFICTTRSSWGKRSLGVKPCYYKEARAMLAGLHWRGKNKCVRLPGDA